MKKDVYMYWWGGGGGGKGVEMGSCADMIGDLCLLGYGLNGWMCGPVNIDYRLSRVSRDTWVSLVAHASRMTRFSFVSMFARVAHVSLHDRNQRR